MTFEELFAPEHRHEMCRTGQRLIDSWTRVASRNLSFRSLTSDTAQALWAHECRTMGLRNEEHLFWHLHYYAGRVLITDTTNTSFNHYMHLGMARALQTLPLDPINIAGPTVEGMREAWGFYLVAVGIVI